MRELLVLNLGGLRYGVWRDEIISIKDVTTIHRLPLTPTCIAGMSILDGRTVMLADLAVCMGLSPVARDGIRHILLLSESEKMTGFVVDGGIASAGISDEEILPMPEYLRNAVMETCVVHMSEPIPVIAISSLYGRIQKADREPPSAEFSIPDVKPLDAYSVTRVRLFESGGETFAAPDRGIEETAVRPGRVSRLALLPQYVTGIAHHNGRIMPLINLARLMKLPAKRPGHHMLSAEISGEGFGLMIDEDHGALNGKDFTVKALPHIAESAWMKAAVLREGVILPLVDPGMLMTVSAEDTARPVHESYNPESRFQSLFGRQDVDVFEFSLLGARHALPRSEVVDSIRFKPYRPIPNVQPIVIGVADHEGGLLPVLDLAACFGRRSLATHEWSMILVRNGDFRCLVITEAAFGERRLPLDMQRIVPITVPHNIVYGCYPDSNVVKLILNVYALAVHFDRSLVRDLLPALSREMQEAPAELVPDLLDHEEIVAAGETEAPAVSAVTVTSTASAEAPVSAANIGLEDTGEVRSEAAVEHAAVEEIKVTGTPEASHDDEPSEVSEQPIETPAAVESVPERVEPESQVQSEPEPSVQAQTEPEPLPEPEHRSEYEPDAQIKAESPSASEEPPRPVAMPEQGPQPETEAEPESVQQPRIDLAAGEEEHKEKPPVPETVTADAETASVESVNAAGEGTITKPDYVVHEGIDRGEEKEEAPPVLVKRYEQPEAVMPVEKSYKPRTVQEREEPKGFGPSKPTGRPAPLEEDRRNRYISFAAIAAVLIALLFFSGLFERPVIDKAGDDDKIKAVTPAPPAEAVSELYEVKKGDTLWHISRRFTGNPFNYPQVAKENDIKNPDLIFPGQKIQVRK